MCTFALVTMVLLTLDVGYSTARRVTLETPADIPIDPEMDQICTALAVPSDDDYFIVNVDWLSEKHLVLFGCEAINLSMTDSEILLNDDHPTWHCPFVSGKKGQEELTGCQGYSRSLLHQTVPLPDGSGLRVGRSAAMNYVVAIQHFHPTINISHDVSTPMYNPPYTRRGPLIAFDIVPASSETALKEFASLIVWPMTYAVIHPGSDSVIRLMCNLSESREIYPVSYNGHTHDKGLAVTGWRVRGDKKDLMTNITADLVGQGTLVKVEAVAAKTVTPIAGGDSILVECRYNNTSAEKLRLGWMLNDEMCYLQINYVVDAGQRILNQTNCYGPYV